MRTQPLNYERDRDSPPLSVLEAHERRGGRAPLTQPLQYEATVPKYDALYLDASSEAYSPSEPLRQPHSGYAVRIHGAQDIDEHDGWPATDGVVAPPLPDRGGLPGPTDRLGWSQGLRPARHMAQLLTGKVLRVDSMGVHPIIGPVGFNNQSGYLAAAVDSQYTDYWTTPRQVAEMLTAPLDYDDTHDDGRRQRIMEGGL